MNTQLRHYWLATASLGLLIYASAWVMGQQSAPNLEREILVESRGEDLEEASVEANGWREMFEEDGEFTEGDRHERPWSRDFEEDDFDDEEDWDFREYDEEEENEWRDDEEEEEYCMVLVEDIRLFQQLIDIASDSDRTAMLAAQLASTYLDTEEAKQLLEESLEETRNSKVKRLIQMQLVEIYARDEQTDMVQVHLKQLIQGL